jgi:hypothetical protein
VRYFFHLHESGGCIVDEEGLELADLDAARRAALTGARALIASEVLDGRLTLGTVMEVQDGRGETVMRLPFRDAVTVEA